MYSAETCSSIHLYFLQWCSNQQNKGDLWHHSHRGTSPSSSLLYIWTDYVANQCSILRWSRKSSCLKVNIWVAGRLSTFSRDVKVTVGGINAPISWFTNHRRGESQSNRGWEWSHFYREEIWLPARRQKTSLSFFFFIKSTRKQGNTGNSRVKWWIICQVWIWFINTQLTFKIDVLIT